MTGGFISFLLRWLGGLSSPVFTPPGVTVPITELEGSLSTITYLEGSL